MFAARPFAEAEDVQPQKNEAVTPETVSNLDEIEEAADFASEITGVRKDFLMGMLVVESDLGRTPGKCTYREVEQGAEQANNKAVKPHARNTFQKRRENVRNHKA